MNASPLPPDLAAPAMHCSHAENHASSPQPATVCQDCYDRLQERVDVLEAAMHIDITEAAQVVYDAVWADPTDPSKTYQNAAQALLGRVPAGWECRRFSGPLDRLPDKLGLEWSIPKHLVHGNVADPSALVPCHVLRAPSLPSTQKKLARQGDSGIETCGESGHRNSKLFDAQVFFVSSI